MSTSFAKKSSLMHFTRTTLPGFFISIMIIFFTACGNGRNSGNSDGIDSSLIRRTAGNDTLLPGKVITRVYCEADASQSYALYIPKKGNSHPLPVVYFFDPHGDGSFPLNKYKSLADSFNFILAGSNNSKNGNDESMGETIWNALLSDTRKRLQPTSNLIYLCGFSGGAKVATDIALRHNEVAGVIANGAGLPAITAAGNFTFSYTEIAGAGDLNMTDLVSIDNSLEQTTTKHRIIFFDGIHEWAPESTMELAFAGWKLDAMRNNSVPKDETFINEFIIASKKRTDSFLQKNDYIKAARECSLSIQMLNGLTDSIHWFLQKDALIKSNPAYQQQAIAQQNLLAKEAAIKSTYEQQLEHGDKDYWTTTIKDVIAKGKMHNNESAMYQRLHAYLSLAFYSVTNQLVKAKQNTGAAYFDELYKLSDPLNSEAWYLSAVIHARNNASQDAGADLIKAISLGFTDKNRILQQQEFENISSQINLDGIVSAVK